MNHRPRKSALPKEAREGLVRAWLEILRERHPEVEWVPVGREQPDPEQPRKREGA
jgi:hypothetical protein